VDCVQLYQPAAAAEARFRVGQGAPAVQQPLQPQQQAAQPSAGARPVKAADAASSSQAAAAAAGAGGAGAGDGRSDQPPATTAHMSAAAKDLIRGIIQQEQRERTQELVDAAWQSLE